MAFPKKRIRRDYQPRDLKDAFRAVKDYGAHHRQLSVERIAELLDTSADALYKWLGDGRMPASKIPAFETVCGVHFVSEYLAAGAGRIVIRVPEGRVPDAEEVSGLQAIVADTVAKLIRCYRGEADIEATREGLTVSLKALAYHRENIVKRDAPELALGGEQ